jgi:serine/threonine protein kinase
VNVDSHDQYRIITALGNGSFGHVEEVEYRSAGRRHTYARKQIRAYPRGQRAGIQKMFTNEIKNILKLQGHPHFVRVVDAYAIEKHFNLVLYPKANEGDLAQFLDEYLHAKDESSNTPKIGKMTEILERAFGCLASGLAHMHQHRIRHKDIKPSNVLIHEGEVLWIDFGHAFDSILLDHSATSGPIGIHTRRYSAPEVISSDRRDSKADIYSLGCVFLEILYAVAFDRVALGPNVLFSANALALNTEIASLESDCAGISTKIGSQRLGPVTELIGLMTTEEAEMRPEANSICCDILSLGSFACSACREQLSTHQEIRLKRLESKQITHDGSTCQVLDTKDTSGKSEAPATSTAMLTNDTVLSVAHADGRRSAADGGKTRHHPTDLNTVKSNMLAKEVVLPIFPSKPLLAHEDQLGTGHNTSLQAAPVSEQQQSDGYTPDYVAHREQDPQTQTLEANGTDAMDVLNYRTATKSPVAVPVAKTTSTVPVITSTEPSHHTTAEENSSDQYYTSPALTKSYSEMETGPTRAPSLQTDSSEESMSEVVNRTKPESHLSTAPSEQTLTTPVESFMPSPVIPMFSPSRYLEDFEPNEPSPLLGPGSSSVLGPVCLTRDVIWSLSFTDRDSALATAAVGRAFSVLAPVSMERTASTISSRNL